MLKKWTLGLLEKVILNISIFATPLVLKQYNSIYSRKWHPHDAMRDEALAETVAYIKAHMSNAVIKDDQIGVLSFACRQQLPAGLVLEFGVRTGTTIHHLAACLPDRSIYGFDSFEGLPESWSGWAIEKGTFARSTLPDVAANVELVKGWFDDSCRFFSNRTLARWHSFTSIGYLQLRSHRARQYQFANRAGYHHRIQRVFQLPELAAA